MSQYFKFLRYVPKQVYGLQKVKLEQDDFTIRKCFKMFGDNLTNSAEPNQIVPKSSLILVHPECQALSMTKYL